MKLLSAFLQCCRNFSAWVGLNPPCTASPLFLPLKSSSAKMSLSSLLAVKFHKRLDFFAMILVVFIKAVLNLCWHLCHLTQHWPFTFRDIALVVHQSTHNSVLNKIITPENFRFVDNLMRTPQRYLKGIKCENYWKLLNTKRSYGSRARTVCLFRFFWHIKGHWNYCSQNKKTSKLFCDVAQSKKHLN